MINTKKEAINRINYALSVAFSLASFDGEHHKDYAIDQIVRKLTGCPLLAGKAKDINGEEYTYYYQGESEEYKEWVKNYNAGKDGPNTYEWKVGTPP